MTPLRIGLAIAGFAAAVLAVILDQPRVVWGAIALLTGSLIVRVLQRRNGGAIARGLSPVRPMAWHIAQFVCAKTRPR